MNEIFQALKPFDFEYFQKINERWQNPVFDRLMPFVTDLHKNPVVIMAVLVFCGVWLYLRPVRASRCLLLIFLCVATSDLISFRVLKPLVERPRPQDTAGVHAVLRTPNQAGASFPSSHAANIFAAATALTLCFYDRFLIWYLYALLIAYSRIYVGVHFPVDVIAGAGVGYLCARFWIKLIGLWVESAPLIPFKSPDFGSGRKWGRRGNPRDIERGQSD